MKKFSKYVNKKDLVDNKSKNRLELFQEIRNKLENLPSGCDKIEGTDILVLGNTRAGKSTVVNYLMDLKLIAKRDTDTHKVFVSLGDTDSEAAGIGTSATSHTEIPKKYNGTKLGNVSLWDTPGFGDSRGPEVDIPSAFYIKHLISKSKSFKIILISDYNDLYNDNVKGFCELLNTFTTIFPNINQIADSVSLIFTKVQRDVFEAAEDDNLDVITGVVVPTIVTKVIQSDVSRFFPKGGKQYSNSISFLRNLVNQNDKIGIFKLVHKVPKENHGRIEDGNIDYNIISAIRASKSIASPKDLKVSISHNSIDFLNDFHKEISDVSKISQECDDVLEAYKEELNCFDREIGRAGDDIAQLKELKTRVLDGRIKERFKSFTEVWTKKDSNSFDALMELAAIDSALESKIKNNGLREKQRLISCIQDVMSDYGLIRTYKDVIKVYLRRIFLPVMTRFDKIQTNLLNKLEELNDKECEDVINKINNKTKNLESQLTGLQEELDNINTSYLRVPAPIGLVTAPFAMIGTGLFITPVSSDIAYSDNQEEDNKKESKLKKIEIKENKLKDYKKFNFLVLEYQILSSDSDYMFLLKFLNETFNQDKETTAAKVLFSSLNQQKFNISEDTRNKIIITIQRKLGNSDNIILKLYLDILLTIFSSATEKISEKILIILLKSLKEESFDSERINLYVEPIKILIKKHQKLSAEVITHLTAVNWLIPNLGSGYDFINKDTTISVKSVSSINILKNPTSANHNIAPNLLKIQQVISTHKKKQQSVEQEIRLQNLQHSLAEHKKKTTVSTEKEVYPDIKTYKPDEGYDTSYWSTRYRNIITLYQLADSGKNLRGDDINWLADNAGPMFNDSCLFANSITRVFSSLIRRRAILETLAIITKKGQKLEKSLIDNVLLSFIEGNSITKSYTITDAKIANQYITQHSKYLTQTELSKIEQNIVNHASEKFKADSNTDVKVQSFLSEELIGMQQSALSALYQCAVRDKKILTDQIINAVQEHLRTGHNEIRSIAYDIIQLKDTDENCQKLFEISLDDLSNKNREIAEKSFYYINEQIKQKSRIDLLFQHNALSKIISTINNSEVTDNIRLGCCEVIYTYHQQKRLNDDLLIKCAMCLENKQSKPEVEKALLRVIFLSAESNKKKLPSTIVQKLAENISSFDTENAYFSIIALSNICQKIEKSTLSVVIKNIDEYLLKDTVIINKDKLISFAVRNQENTIYPSISQIVAKMFLHAAQQKIELSGQNIDKLVKVLSGEETQTAILASKTLYYLSKYQSINNGLLVELRNHINSNISDITVYTKLAYINILANFSKCKSPLLQHHLNSLPEIFEWESLELGDQIYTDELNKGIFDILLHAAHKCQIFNKTILEMFNNLLIVGSDEYKTNILNIIIAYTEKGRLIPENIIDVIEKEFCVSNSANKTKQVLTNVIKNKQLVSDRALRLFADDFYYSEDHKVRKNTFDILNLANNQQNLSSEIFHILRMERASYLIKNPNTDNAEIEGALQYLKNKIISVYKLSINNLNSLNKFIKDNSTSDLYKEALSLIVFATKNKQILPDYLVDSLTTTFDRCGKNEIQVCLVKIFYNITKNNQRISKNLESKLEEFLDNNDISDQILSIFILLIQQGKICSNKIIGKIFNTFLNSKDSQIRQELSCVISTIIPINNITRDIDPCLIREVLRKGIEEENLNIVTHCIDSFVLFSPEELKNIVKKAIDMDLCIDMRAKITEELLKEKYELPQDVIKELKLAVLSDFSYSNEEFLLELKKINGTGDAGNQYKLLSKNFLRITKILDIDLNHQEEILDILIKCNNKKSIPIELIDSIVTLITSTNSKDLQKLCIEFVKKIVEAGVELTSQTINTIITSEIDTDIFKVILSNLNITNHDISNKSKLLIEIYKGEITNLENLLKNIIEEFDNNIILPSFAVEKLCGIYKSSSNSESKVIAEVFALLIEKDYEYASNLEIVSAIEFVIKRGQVNKRILDNYTRIIQANKFQDLQEVVDSLTNLFISNTESVDNSSVMKCILKAVEIKSLRMKDEFISALENNLTVDQYNQCQISSLNIRKPILAKQQEKKYLSFQILKQLKYISNELNVFKNFCLRILEELQRNYNSSIKLEINEENISLIETLLITSDPKLDILSKYNRDQWNKELLLNDLVLSFYNASKINNQDIFSIYDKWSNLESLDEYKKDNNSDIILSGLIKQINHCGNTYQIIDIIDIINSLKYLNFIQASEILRSSFKDWSQKLKNQAICNILSKLCSTLKVNNKYIAKVANDITVKLGFKLTKDLLTSFESVDSIEALIHIVDFIKNQKVEVLNNSDIVKYKIADLQKQLNIKVLNRDIQCTSNNESYKTLEHLLDKGWKFKDLKKIIDINTSGDKTKFLLIKQVLEIINNYNLSLSNHYNEIYKILTKFDTQDWIIKISKLAVEYNFQKEGILKTVQTLQAEFINSNFVNDRVNEESYHWNVLDNILKSYKEYVNYNKQDIISWSNKVKTNPQKFLNSNDGFTEALAIIKQANFLVTGFQMTDAQILSCLVALKKPTGKGRLLEVCTGEGKSTIVSVLAIIQALQGKKVDIVTSSTVLAKRDAKEKTKLYEMFGLTVDNNSDNINYIKGTKRCYKKDIVYGDAAQFQFDVLRDEYSGLGTLGNRKIQNSSVIVDEVDSMLIDDGSKIARLSSTMAGMDQLQPIYHLLWHRLSYLQQHIVKLGNTLYFLEGKVEDKQGKTVLQYADASGKIMEISDLEEYIRAGNDLGYLGQKIKGDGNDFCQKHLKEYIYDEQSDQIIIDIPAHYKEFVKKQITKWVKNSILAFSYEENVHYIVHDGMIKPVDFNGTGTVQNSTNWSDGLHQFLQIKHQLKMTSETFSTNFLSNLGYFKRYGTNLYGLTGTLGSEQARKYLKEVYNLDLVNIPLSRQKQYLQLSDMVCKDSSEWHNQIINSAIAEAEKGRGALVICETIRDAKNIADKLKQKYREGAIKLYTINNEEQEGSVEKIDSGEIIVATNLAGRGTDIKTDDIIEENGGLHVCLTFLPENLRVEEQALGRTARQGKRGTGQLILNTQNLQFSDNIYTSEIRNFRDECEKQKLDIFIKNELKTIEVKDQLFKKFCDFITSIREKIKDKEGRIEKLTNKAKEFVNYTMPTIYEASLVSAIEEQWAMFLCKIDDKDINIENANSALEEVIHKIEEDFIQEKVVKNPYYYIAIANNLIANDSIINNHHQKAIKYFDKAIELDPNFSSAAYVGKAWALLQGSKKFFTEGDIKGHKHEDNYKNKAVEAFNKALKLLNEELAVLGSIQALLHHQTKPGKNDLNKQLVQKIDILNLYINNINNTIDIVKRSQRLIDIHGQKENFKKSILGLEKNKTFNFLEKAQFDTYDITFHDLTVRSDISTKDQAITTILSNNKHKVAIESQIGMEQLNLLLNSDIEIKDITKEAAIMQLENNSSFLDSYLGKTWASCQVNLIIIDGDKEKLQENLQITDALKNIRDQNNDNLRFNLKLVDANEIAKKVQNVLKLIDLDLKFDSLNIQDAKQKLKDFCCDSVNLEITATKTEIINFIKKINKSTKIMLIDRTLFNEKQQVLDPNNVESVLSEITKTDYTIRFETIEEQDANAITCLSDQAKININFSKVKKLKNNLTNGHVKISFNELNSDTAKQLIPILRKENIDFSLSFQKLNQDQAKRVIKNASIDQENIVISRVRELSEMFVSKNNPEIELGEFKARGIQYLLDCNEKCFIPWASIAAVSMLAAAQAAAGIALISTGFGANAGIGLITEGVADGISGFNTYNNRQFSWESYLKQKAVSIVISATTSGIKSIKDVARNSKPVINKFIGKEVFEQAGNKVFNGSAAVIQTLTSTEKSLKTLGFKQLGVVSGEALAREALNRGSSYISSISLESLKPKMAAFIEQQIIIQFSNQNLRNIVRTMNILDLAGNEQKFKYQINNTVSEIINPKNSFLQKQLDTVIIPLLKGVFADPKYLGNNFSAAMRIIVSLEGLFTSGTVVTNVYNKLYRKLLQTKTNSSSIVQLLTDYCDMNHIKAQSFVSILANENIIQLNQKDNISLIYRNLNNNNSLWNKKLLDYNAKKDKIIKFLNYYSDSATKNSDEFDQYFDDMIKFVSEKLTTQIINIIESQLIFSWSSYAAGNLVSKISTNIQNHFITKSHIQEQKNAEEINNDQTFIGLIHNEAKKHMIAYQQIQSMYYVIQKQTNTNTTHISEPVQKYLKGIIDNAPANIALMQKMAIDNDINLKIVINNPDYQFTAQDKEDKVVVAVFVQDTDSNSGYWQMITATGAENISNANNNGGFEIIAKATNKTVKQVRKEAAQSIEDNHLNFQKSIEVQEWIENRYPGEAKNLLSQSNLKKKDDYSKESLKKQELLIALFHDDEERLKGFTEEEIEAGKQKLENIKKENGEAFYTISTSNSNQLLVEGSYKSSEKDGVTIIKYIVVNKNGSEQQQVIKYFTKNNEIPATEAILIQTNFKEIERDKELTSEYEAIQAAEEKQRNQDIASAHKAIQTQGEKQRNQDIASAHKAIQTQGKKELNQMLKFKSDFLQIDDGSKVVWLGISNYNDNNIPKNYTETEECNGITKITTVKHFKTARDTVLIPSTNLYKSEEVKYYDSKTNKDLGTNKEQVEKKISSKVANEMQAKQAKATQSISREADNRMQAQQAEATQRISSEAVNRMQAQHQAAKIKAEEDKEIINQQKSEEIRDVKQKQRFNIDQKNNRQNIYDQRHFSQIAQQSTNSNNRLFEAKGDIDRSYRTSGLDNSQMCRDQFEPLSVLQNKDYRKKFRQFLTQIEYSIISTGQSQKAPNVGVKPKASGFKNQESDRNDGVTEQEYVKNAFNQKNNADYYYQASDIRLIQQRITESIDNPNNIVFSSPIGDGENLEYIFADLLNLVKENQPTVCAYNLGDFHWIALSIVKKGDQIYVLYKDSQGNRNDAFEKLVREIDSNIQLVFNLEREQISGVDCGIFALKNMQIMAEQLTDDTDQFIENFTSFENFCNLEEAKTLRCNDYAYYYVSAVIAEMQHDKQINAVRQTLREKHFSEAQEIQGLLAASDIQNSFCHKYIAINNSEDSTQMSSVVTIEIISYPDIELLNEDYKYGYRISLSEDLKKQSKNIFKEISKKLGVELTVNDNELWVIINSDDIKHASIKKVDRTKIEVDQVNITYGELLESLSLFPNEVLIQELKDLFQYGFKLYKEAWAMEIQSKPNYERLSELLAKEQDQDSEALTEKEKEEKDELDSQINNSKDQIKNKFKLAKDYFENAMKMPMIISQDCKLYYTFCILKLEGNEDFSKGMLKYEEALDLADTKEQDNFEKTKSKTLALLNSSWCKFNDGLQLGEERFRDCLKFVKQFTEETENLRQDSYECSEVDQDNSCSFVYFNGEIPSQTDTMDIPVSGEQICPEQTIFYHN